MKEDVVAANLANLRQSINELKECVNRQNVTPNQPEQHIKVDLDEKTNNLTTMTNRRYSLKTNWNGSSALFQLPLIRYTSIRRVKTCFA